MDRLLKELDLYVVSHGGVASNYLVNYLVRKNIKVRLSENHKCSWQRLVHFPIKLDPNVPCLFLHGDYLNSIVSQWKRGLLYVNMNKIQLGIDDQKDRSEQFLKLYPDDPVGIKSQLTKFSQYPNTVFLLYPYTKETLKDALARLRIHINTDDLEFFPRKTHIRLEDIHQSPLKQICEPYDEYQFQPTLLPIGE